MSAQSPSGETHPERDASHAHGRSDTGGAGETGRKRRVLDADLLPWLGGGGPEADVDIEIYVVTGRHGMLRVPESFCRECHMFARRADAAAERADVDVNVRILSWWTRVLGALRHGGYHPPVMVVGGKRLCQGHDVPTTDDVLEAIDGAVDRS